ncbi:response regulator [Actinoplanes sp. NPDC049681]|uniref:response regulator n=1 Tax=Actinoplanes sp. NPDC049681 TaxID=3363905 RepID=UPI0037AB03FA
MAFVVAVIPTTLRRQVVEEALRRDGHMCVFFGDVATAVAEVADGTADLLLVDGLLPGLSILQVCDAMWSRPATADIPIVVCEPLGPDGVPGDRRVRRTALEPEALGTTVTAALTAGPAGRDRVLLVEDDDAIAEPLIDGLARYGIRADRVSTGTAALAAPPPSLVLLDLGLPDMDGLEVCRRLRSARDVPVIMLTARGDETDRVVGLELGADDYLAKPFSVRELVARIRAVGRRTYAGQLG